MKRNILKILLIGLAICSIIVSVTVLSACAKHEHAFGEYEVTIPATCETPGEKTRSCDCGYTETEQIPAEHDWSDVETIPADCVTQGKQTRTCSKCGADDTVILPTTEHKWSEYSITNPATCKTLGEQMRICSVCKTEETETIPKTAHNWSDFTTTTPAECLVSGEKTRSCSICGDVETEVIPQTGHSWQGVEIIKDATCEEDGLRSVKCANCSATSDEDVIPALGHTKASGFPLTEPTCESTGQNQNKCAVCGKTYREIVPALGHNYSDEFTVDVAPTINEEGEQSRHCTNNKCTSRIDIQPIPKLISEAYFRIYVVRGANQKILPTTYNPMVKIFNEEGKQVAVGYAWGNGSGVHMFETLLPFGTYTVSIVNTLPAGFECDTYTISEKDGTYPYDTEDRYPTITMHLYSHLGTGTNSNGDKKGTVINDFSVTTIDGVTVTIGELLAQKKLVWLNFYYNNCSPCRSEAPEIIRIAKLFDVAVICFNGKDSVDDIRSGAENIFKFPDSFYIVDDTSSYYGNMFGRYAYPLNVFIDSGGCVFESVTGSNYSSQFYNFINDNLFDTPQKTSTVAKFVEMPAILPDEHRYL